MTRESDYFLKIPFIKRIPDQTKKYLFSFSFPIGNAKFTSQLQFKSDTLVIKGYFKYS